MDPVAIAAIVMAALFGYKAGKYRGKVIGKYKEKKDPFSHIR